MEDWDFARLENGLMRNNAEIDTKVFKLYGLDKSEINTVLESFSKLPSYQEKVLASFSR